MGIVFHGQEIFALEYAIPKFCKIFSHNTEKMKTDFKM